MRVAAVAVPLVLVVVFVGAWTQRPKGLTRSSWQRAATAIRACQVTEIEEFGDRKVAVTFALSRDRYRDPKETSLRLVREPRLGAAAKIAAAVKGCGITAIHG